MAHAAQVTCPICTKEGTPSRSWVEIPIDTPIGAVAIRTCDHGHSVRLRNDNDRLVVLDAGEEA